MRKSTLASLLILCGSSAAIAQVTQTPTSPTTQSNTESGVLTDNVTVDSPTPQTTGPTDPIPTPTTPTEPTTDDTSPPTTTGTPDAPSGTTGADGAGTPPGR